MNNTPKKRNLPSTKSVQYDLFASFFGEAAELSNTIELWDAIPKYSVNLRQQAKMRSQEGRLPLYTSEFVYSTRQPDGHRIEHKIRLEIQPAIIKTSDGPVDFYPSVNEELVEEVIRKIFSDQSFGFHDPKTEESWARFSAQMIKRELHARGKTRSIDEIKRSIEILSKTNLSLFYSDDQEPFYSNAIITEVTRVTRQKYLDDSSATWIARLSALVSKSVNKITYRQFNYGLFMSLPCPLSRWLHKRLSHNFVNANHLNSYNLLFSTIKRDSGLLRSKRHREDIKKLEETLDVLKSHNVISRWTRAEEYHERKSLIDVRYEIFPHMDFIDDVKRANARAKDARQNISSGNING